DVGHNRRRDHQQPQRGSNGTLHSSLLLSNSGGWRSRSGATNGAKSRAATPIVSAATMLRASSGDQWPAYTSTPATTVSQAMLRPTASVNCPSGEGSLSRRTMARPGPSSRNDRTTATRALDSTPSSINASAPTADSATAAGQAQRAGVIPPPPEVCCP